MTEAQIKVIASLAKYINKINPVISKKNAKRIAPLVPVHVVELRVDGDELKVVPNRDLECFIIGLGIGIEVQAGRTIT